MTICPVTVKVDTGLGLSTISARVDKLLQGKFSNVNVIARMEDLQKARVADGQILHVTETYPGESCFAH